MCDCAHVPFRDCLPVCANHPLSLASATAVQMLLLRAGPFQHSGLTVPPLASWSRREKTLACFQFLRVWLHAAQLVSRRLQTRKLLGRQHTLTCYLCLKLSQFRILQLRARNCVLDVCRSLQCIQHDNISVTSQQQSQLLQVQLKRSSPSCTLLQQRRTGFPSCPLALEVPSGAPPTQASRQHSLAALTAAQKSST